MSRPPQPPMTAEEYDRTAKLGSREASWEISRARGAHADPSKLVGRMWVQEWRRAWKLARQETTGGRKPDQAALTPHGRVVAGNGGCGEVGEPVPHSEGVDKLALAYYRGFVAGRFPPSTNQAAIMNAPEGGSAAAVSADLEQNGGPKA